MRTRKNPCDSIASRCGQRCLYQDEGKNSVVMPYRKMSAGRLGWAIPSARNGPEGPQQRSYLENGAWRMDKAIKKVVMMSAVALRLLAAANPSVFTNGMHL